MPLSAKMLEVHCDYLKAFDSLACLVYDQPRKQCNSKAISILICISRRIAWPSYKVEGPNRVVTRNYSDK